VPPDLPSFDLVVATIGRHAELERLLDSLAAQSHRALRVIVVDQNEGEGLAPVLARRQLDVLHLRTAPGLARARNVALAELRADVVAFPDDDCTYPPTLLERVAERLAGDLTLDGLSARNVDSSGASDPGWPAVGMQVTKANVWNLVASAGVFVRRPLVESVGRFDERLGLGSGEPWSSGEETDYVIRALESGARIEYDPSLVVQHALAAHDPEGLRARGRREGASVGYLLRKHDYPLTTLARMVVRPLGGIGVSLARRDTPRARFHAETLRGRVRGYVGARRSNSSA
jgi:GT2 family glycosyltransferase